MSLRLRPRCLLTLVSLRLRPRCLLTFALTCTSSFFAATTLPCLYYLSLPRWPGVRLTLPLRGRPRLTLKERKLVGSGRDSGGRGYCARWLDYGIVEGMDTVPPPLSTMQL